MLLSHRGPQQRFMLKEGWRKAMVVIWGRRSIKGYRLVLTETRSPAASAMSLSLFSWRKRASSFLEFTQYMGKKRKKRGYEGYLFHLTRRENFQRCSFCLGWSAVARSVHSGVRLFLSSLGIISHPNICFPVISTCREESLNKVLTKKGKGASVVGTIS